MTLSEMLLPEFDQEMAKTRRTLERIPEDKFGWKPHEKSMTLGRLASHLAEIPTWGSNAINQDSVDIMPAGAPPYQPVILGSRAEILEMFDKNVADARRAISRASDEQFMQPWSLLAGGKTIFTESRLTVLRAMVISHEIHHRAQLGVYLRLNNIPVPAIYGPSADESFM